MKTTSLILSAGLAFAGLRTVSAAALYTAGHGDIGIGYDAGDFDLHVHIEGGTVDGVVEPDAEFGSGDIRVVVPLSTFSYSSANGGRPAGAQWNPIGVGAGVSFWSLPQSNTGPGGAAALNAPFLGIGSEELAPGDWTGDLTFTLTGMNGPGVFSLWQDGFSPTFFMSTADGISGADSFSFTAGGHDHFNYGFTQPGLYQVTFEVEGTHAVDGLKSGSATYTFQVVGGYVPEPGSFGLVALGALVLRRLRGFTGSTADSAGVAKVRRERSVSRRKPRW